MNIQVRPKKLVPQIFFATCFLNCSIFYLARLWPFQEIIIPSGSGSWHPVKRRNLLFGGHVVRKTGSKSSGVQLSSVVTQAHEVSTMDACPERPGHAWTFYAKSGRIGQYGIEIDIPRNWDSQAACQNIPIFRKKLKTFQNGSCRFWIEPGLHQISQVMRQIKERTCERLSESSVRISRFPESLIVGCWDKRTDGFIFCREL